MIAPVSSSAAWRTSALACALLACLLPAAARAVAGPRGADIHVEFRPSVDDASRAQIARRYDLINPRKLADTYTWRYELTNPSRDNIEALVREPAIEDTHEIDRNRYVLSDTAPRTARRQRWAEGGDGIVGFADGLAIVLLGLAAVTLVARRTPAVFLQRGIPEVDAVTAGVFRIVFGGAVLWFFATHPVTPSWLDATFDLEIEGALHARIVDWLRARPDIVTMIGPWLMTAGVAFTIGVFTRTSYALFVAGAIVWAYVAMTLDSTHPHSTLMLTLVALLPSRWGDALSVDAWLRRRRGAAIASGAPGRRYGYSVWVPGLVFGVAFAAAGWAKLTVPPGWTDWIANGTVKYHFVADAANAAVDWGLQFANHPRLAVFASGVGLITELLIVTGAFMRSDAYRLVMGVASLALLVGFRLFIGVLWSGWWILLLGFLPWQRMCAFLRRMDAGGEPVPRLATAAQVVLIAAILAQQTIASRLWIERAPMFSRYDMYAGTYESPEAWNATRDPIYRIVAMTDRGRRELSACNPHGEFVNEFRSALKGSAAAAASVWDALRGCGEDISDAREVTLEGDLHTFNWKTLVFTTTRTAVVLGPLLSDRHAAVRDNPPHAMP